MADDGTPAEPPPPPVSRTLRIWYGVIQTVALSVFAVLCWICARFEQIYSQLGMTILPAPTEAWLGMAPFFRTIPGMLLLASVGVALVTLGLRGKLDRVLRKLVVLNVIGTFALVGFYVLAVFSPIIQVQEALRDK